MDRMKVAEIPYLYNVSIKFQLNFKMASKRISAMLEIGAAAQALNEPLLGRKKSGVNAVCNDEDEGH